MIIEKNTIGISPKKIYVVLLVFTHTISGRSVVPRCYNAGKSL